MPSSNIPCRFFATQTCKNGDNCKFRHVPPEEFATILSTSGAAGSSGTNKYPCRFFMKGSCLRGKTCKFSHDRSFMAVVGEGSAGDGESEDSCAICFEKPGMYGLLLNCNHSFCLTCVRKWRGIARGDETSTGSKTGHLCPMCRTSSPYVIPSIVGFPNGGSGKDKTIELYRARLSTLVCKYFYHSPANQRFCPYGDDCLYMHPSNKDENIRYKFGPNYLEKLKEKRAQRRRTRMMADTSIPRALEQYLMGAALSTDEEFTDGHLDEFEIDEDEQYIADIARHFSNGPQSMQDFVDTMASLTRSHRALQDDSDDFYDYDEYDLDDDDI